MKIVAAAVTTGLLLLFGAPDAHALGPIDLEAGLRVGAATNPSDGVNPFGIGVGGRAGIDVLNLYVGASAIHYFGSSETLPLVGEVSTSATLVGGEIGYSITSLPIVSFRPQIGVGRAGFSTSVGGTDTTSGELYLEPGVLVYVPLGLVFVGADANALVLPGVDTPTGSETYTSFSVHGQFGLRL